MNPNDAKKALEELARRGKALSTASGVVGNIRKELFDKQLAFMDDPSQNKAAICTRRAGKTSLWARYCTIVALEKPKSLIRVWGITRLRVKQLLFQEFIDVARRHRIDIRTHETELWVKFDNGSEIRLVGADKDQSIQRKRGDKTQMEVVLEAQLFGPVLRTLVEDVAEPCLIDNRTLGLGGTMCMEGTPGPIPAGYWHSVTGGFDGPGQWVGKGVQIRNGNRDETVLVGAGWSCHRWSLLDNPFLPGIEAEVEKIRQRRSWTADNPTYMREYLGRWVKDDSALYYAFDEVKNTFSIDEIKPWGPGWSHCLGLDIGWKDATAITVWGWHENDPNLYEAFSWKHSKKFAGDVVDVIEDLHKRGFNIIKQVADVGGGGRLYVEDMQARYGVVFDAAEKTKKYDHVMILNDQLRAGKIKVQRGSALAQELATLLKDPNWEPESGKPPGEDPRCENHSCDSALYALRGCFNYAFTEERTAPARGSSEWLEAIEKADEEALSREPDADAWWDSGDYCSEDYDYE